MQEPCKLQLHRDGGNKTAPSKVASTVMLMRFIKWARRCIAPPAKSYEKEVIYHNAKMIDINELMIFILLFIVFHNKVSNSLLYSWFFTAMIVKLPFYSISLSCPFISHLKHSKHYYSFYLFGILMSGGLWGTLYFLMIPRLDIYYQMFLTLVGAGVATVALYAFMPNIRAFLYYILPAIMPLSWGYFQVDSAAHHLIGWLLIVLFFIVLFTIKNIALVYKKLNDAVVEAQRANQAKSEFLANMSHEMRIPMNAIVSIGNLLQADYLSKQKQKDYLQKLQLSSATLLQTLNGILDLSKIEAKKMQLDLSDFQLVDLVDTMKSMFAAQIERKQLYFTVKADDCLQHHLKGDVLKLGIVLQNIISNAIKFTNEGGITLEIKELFHNKDYTSISFTIRDTGIGISEEGQKTLFMPFYQVNISDSRQYGGTGIGLSISQQLLHLMDSHISVKSTPSKGSAFSFQVSFKQLETKETLAIADEPKKTIRQTLEVVPKFKDKSILIIDDDELSRFFVKELLDCFGVSNIFESSTAKAGVERLKQQDIDLLLLDIQMPEMDGYEVATLIRDNPEWNNLPIICLTGYAHEDDRRKALKAGATRVLLKPVEPELLRTTLLECL